MAGHLEELCYRKGIELHYIYDKVLGKPEEKGIIKVHEAFKYSTYEVADAIIKYYSDPEKNIESISTILEYLKKICLPINADKKDLQKFSDDESKKSIEKNKDDDYEEVNITKIDINSLYGEKQGINESKTIKLQDNDVVELKILVEPPSYISKGGEENGIQVKEN